VPVPEVQIIGMAYLARSGTLGGDQAEAGLKSWAHTYMAGSLLGTVLIVAALVAFVPLVSLKAPDEWRTPGLGLVVGGGATGDVAVGPAVVAAAKHPGAGGLNSNSVSGPGVAAGTAIDSVRVSGREPHTGRPGGAEAGAPAKGIAAISPASIEVARNPDSPTSEGAGAAVPLPNPPETDSAPAPTTTDGEVGDVGKLGETPPTPPIDAGTGTEGPESLPPERPESVPPPPSGSSTEGDGVSDCPGEGDEGEAVQAGNGTAPQLP
jgi:hypothetical protein